jgi:hypothetical protein
MIVPYSKIRNIVSVWLIIAVTIAITKQSNSNSLSATLKIYGKSAVI